MKLAFDIFVLYIPAVINRKLQSEKIYLFIDKSNLSYLYVFICFLL